MSSLIDIDAAALQPLTKRDMLEQLLKAKAESDRKNYGSKQAIMRNLLKSNADEFYIDSEEGGIAGLTHEPTNFKMHLPFEAIENRKELRRQLTKAAGTTEDWNVSDYLDEFIDSHGDKILWLKQAAQKLPAKQEFQGNVWYNLENDALYFAGTMPDTLEQLWCEKLANSNCEMYRIEDDYPASLYDEPWSLILRSKSAQTKGSPALKGVLDAWGLTAGPANAWYGGPRPLSSMLVGGLAGAGLGYLGGSIAEGLAEEKFERGKLRRLMALMGAGAGAVPGALWALGNTSRLGARGLISDSEGNIKWGSVRELLPDSNPNEEFYKFGVDISGLGATEFINRPIPVDDFGRVVWSGNDPYSPFSTRAAATGLVDAASAYRGNSSLVMPTDVARIAIGMGSGYASGMLVGKTLGAMAGLKPEAQKTLQQAGTWAGMLNTVLPMAFGGTTSPF